MELATGPTLMVGGGEDIFGSILDTSEFYDINTDTWTFGPDMPNRIYGITSVEFG